jgi:hypothetical protein
MRRLFVIVADALMAALTRPGRQEAGKPRILLVSYLNLLVYSTFDVVLVFGYLVRSGHENSVMVRTRYPRILHLSKRRSGKIV